MRKKILILVTILIVTIFTACGKSANGYTKILSQENCGVGEWTYSEKELIEGDLEEKNELYSSVYIVSSSFNESTQYLFKYDNYKTTTGTILVTTTTTVPVSSGTLIPFGSSGTTTTTTTTAVPVTYTHDYYRNYELTRQNNIYYVSYASYEIKTNETDSTTVKTIIDSYTKEYTTINEALKTITMDSNTSK